MATDYTDFRDGWVYDLIAENGESMTLTRITGSVYDASAGTNTPTTADVTVSGVEQMYQDRDVDGTLIQTGDRKVLIEGKALAAASVAPSENDTLTYDGTAHKVITVSRTRAGGVNIVYELQVRAV
jgi:hypothetical protein